MSATKRWRLVSVVQRAGEHGLPGESVVVEEAAVTEAIHAAAHPGRTRSGDGDETGGGSDDETAAETNPESSAEAEEPVA